MKADKKKRASNRYWVMKNSNLYARLQYRDSAGRSREKYRSISDKRHARSVVEEMRRELLEHGPETLDADRMKFERLAETYKNARLVEAKYVNGIKVSGRRSLLSLFTALRALVDYFGQRTIRSIKAGDLENYKQLRLNTPTQHGTQRKMATVNRELELLRAMLNYAIQNEWLIRNPFTLTKGIISKAAESQRDRVLSFDEERRLLEACVGRRKHLRPLLICALDTAMRRGEIFKMRWADVRFSSNEIFIPQTNTKTEESRTVGMTFRLRIELEELWELSPRSLDETVFGISTTIKTAFGSLCAEADRSEERRV